MPIGFWAVSREDVRELLEFRSGRHPSPTQVDRAVKALKVVLEDTLEGVIKEQAKEIIFEETGI